ncbi:MAG: IS1634 family transposase, partial [Candidatus Magnetobacterium sp. LHC-1]
KEAIEQTEIKSMVSIDEHYSFSVTESTYGDVKQRWLIVFSKHAYEREMKTANKMVLNGSEREMQEFKKLCQKEFACIPDAEKALSGYEKGLKHTIVENGCIKGFAKYKKVGRPKKETEPDKIVYQIEGTIATSLSKRKLLINRKGFFVLATNELDENLLSHIEVFENYKNQSFVERGFRFLKDPMFLASSLYLKSPERIMALLMVMTVCLLVYAALEYKIRKGLKEQNKAFPNQKGVPIQNPTSRWIFQCFVGIHLLIIQDMQEIILNLNDLHRLILYILGDNYASFYT